MILTTIGTAFLAWLLTMVGMPSFLNFMRQKGWGQSIREEGPEDHQVKAGTPTMGGLVVAVAILIGLSVCYPYEWTWSLRQIVLFVVIGAGLFLGIVDDWGKVSRQQNLGLTARQKMSVQLLTALATAALFVTNGVDGVYLLGEERGGVLAVLIVVFGVIVGTTNAVNLTDGLDGLAALTSICPLIALSYVAYDTQAWTCYFLGVATVGALIAFLWYNAYPAEIFMGDTGSLFIGSIMAVMALWTGHPFVLLVAGLVNVAEAGSVIMQVAYFKKTKGKRIFRMSPLHHHFCLGGLHEVKVTFRFFVVSFAVSLLSIYCYVKGWI